MPYQPLLFIRYTRNHNEGCLLNVILFDCGNGIICLCFLLNTQEIIMKGAWRACPHRHNPPSNALKQILFNWKKKSQQTDSTCCMKVSSTIYTLDYVGSTHTLRGWVAAKLKRLLLRTSSRTLVMERRITKVHNQSQSVMVLCTNGLCDPARMNAPSSGNPLWLGCGWTTLLPRFLLLPLTLPK